MNWAGRSELTRGRRDREVKNQHNASVPSYPLATPITREANAGQNKRNRSGKSVKGDFASRGVSTSTHCVICWPGRA
jgi:hypothetical protein